MGSAATKIQKYNLPCVSLTLALLRMHAELHSWFHMCDTAHACCCGCQLAYGHSFVTEHAEASFYYRQCAVKQCTKTAVAAAGCIAEDVDVLTVLRP
jgi:hypothetical protein